MTRNTLVRTARAIELSMSPLGDHGMRTALAVALLALVDLSILAAATEPSVPPSVAATTQATGEAPAPDVVDRVIRFAATDGTPLEAKLSVPPNAKGPVPVVFRLHG